MRVIRPCVTTAGCLALAASMTIPAAADTADFAIPDILLQTTDLDNLEHIRVALCAEGPKPQGSYSLTAQVVTPGETMPVGICAAHQITDILGFSQLDDARGASDDYDSNEVVDRTNDTPALVQDVAESVQVEDSVKNVNVLGVAVQEAVKDDEVPDNVNANQINLFHGEVATVGVADSGDEDRVVDDEG